MNYSDIIFDVDGTLLDNDKVVRTMWQMAIEEQFGKHYELNELDFVMGIPGEAMMAKLGAENPKEAYSKWVVKYRELNCSIHFFPNVEQCIRELHHRGIHLGIATSRNKEEVLNNDCDLPKVIDLFDEVISFEDSPRPKPFPDPLLTYINRRKVSKDKVLYIGDSAADCKCAHDAGIDFGLALWNGEDSHNMQAKYFFNSPLEILDVMV